MFLLALLQAVTPAPESLDLSALVRLAFEKVAGGQWAALAGVGLMMVVYCLRKWLAMKWAFLGTARGGALLVVVTSVLLATGHALIAVGWSGVNAGLLLSALQVAAWGGGGLAFLKAVILNEPAPTSPVGPA